MKEIELPNARHGIAAYYVIAPAEASANLARYDGVRYGPRTGNGDLTSMYEQTRHDGFGDEVKRRIMIGTYALSSGYYEAYYGTAQKVRTKIAQDFSAAFEEVDFVVSPTSATVAFKLGERTADPLAMYLSDYYTVPMPLAGIPAISIPCGLSDGLPVGFQIAGPAFSEARHPRRRARAREVDRLRGSACRMTPPITEPEARIYEPVIGIEIHVQLRTRTKMFCGCALSFGEEPNTLMCPVCLGHPGTLPVTNAEAVHYGLMIAMAFDCEIAPRSIFHRKNYFYPDLPKGYQISQYDIPLGRHGQLGDVRIHRVHMEEDAAKLIHAGSLRTHPRRVHERRGLQPRRHAAGGDRHGAGSHLGRPGCGLRPAAPGHAAAHGRVRREHGGGLAADGRERVDPPGRHGHARHEDRAEEHELVPLPRARDRRRDRRARSRSSRAAARWSRRRSTTTRRAARSPRCARRRRRTTTATSRSRTSCPIAPTEEMLERARAALPELPAARAERLERDLELPAETARLLAFRSELGDFFESGRCRRAALLRSNVANWTTNELAARVGDGDLSATKLEPEAFAELVAMVGQKQVSASAGREVLDVLSRRAAAPRAVVEAKGLGRAESGELEQIVDQAIADNPDAVEKIRAGKGQAIGAIVGAVMRETKGRADGGEVQRMINERIGA